MFTLGTQNCAAGAYKYWVWFKTQKFDIFHYVHNNLLSTVTI